MNTIGWNGHIVWSMILQLQFDPCCHEDNNQECNYEAYCVGISKSKHVCRVHWTDSWYLLLECLLSLLEQGQSLCLLFLQGFNSWCNQWQLIFWAQFFRSFTIESLDMLPAMSHRNGVCRKVVGWYKATYRFKAV